MKSIKLGRVLEVLGALLVASPGVMRRITHTGNLGGVLERRQNRAVRRAQGVQRRHCGVRPGRAPLRVTAFEYLERHEQRDRETPRSPTTFSARLPSRRFPVRLLPDKIIPANFIKATDTHVDYSGTTLAFRSAGRREPFRRTAFSSLNKTAAHSAISTAPNCADELRRCRGERRRLRRPLAAGSPRREHGLSVARRQDHARRIDALHLLGRRHLHGWQRSPDLVRPEERLPCPGRRHVHSAGRHVQHRLDVSRIRGSARPMRSTETD